MVRIKRFLLIGSLLFMTTILAGCINLKIGDDTLRISMDGIELIEGGSQSAVENSDKDDTDGINEEDQESDNADDGSAANDSDNQQTKTGDSGTSTDGSGTETGQTSKADTEQTQGKAADDSGSKTDGSYTCPEHFDQDYSEIREKLNHEFYFPECSHVVSVEDTGSTLEFVLHHDPKVLTLEDDNDEITQAILNVHHAYEELGDVYDHYPNFGFVRGYSYFYLHGDGKGDTKVDYEFELHSDLMTINVVYTYP